MVTKTELIVNIILHVLILLSILSLLFWFVITKLEKDNITKEVNNNISDYFDNLKENLNEKDKNDIKNIIKNSNNVLEDLKKLYVKPSENNETTNRWVLYSNLLYILLILGILLTIVLTIRLVCKSNDFPFWHILKENIIIFTFVGMIEVFFFLNIALKFIPTKPSLIINSVLNSLKEKFNN
jgi:uncharacterized protein involved in cysteine biosynthesis